MIKISYKDGQNWTDINGNVRNWTNAHNLYKDERIQAGYLAPELITGSWNGKVHDIQHIIWDIWHLEFWIKESELQEVNKLQSCSTITITDVDNDLSHSVDMQTGDWFNFSAPERIKNTANWKIVFEYRTNKTVIPKFEALSNVVTVALASTYYSKYEKLPYIGEKQDIFTLWGEDGDKLLHEINEVGFKVLFYMDSSDMETFKNDYNTVTSSTIDATSIIKKMPLEITELGEDNYEIIMSVITSRSAINYNATLTNSTTSYLTSSASPVYYSKYNALKLIKEPQVIKIDWGEDKDIILRETHYEGYRVFLYLNDADTETFSQDWATNEFTFGSSALTIEDKMPLEINTNEAGFNEIIVSCETSKATDAKSFSTVATFSYNSGFTYITRQALLLDNVSSEKIEVDWSDGSKKTVRETWKEVRKAFYYTVESGYENFIEDWASFDDWSIEGTDILEKLPLEVEVDDYGYYKMVIPYVIDINTVTTDLGADHTHTLVITDSSSYTYYSDYPVVTTIEDTELTQYDNEGGSKTTTKGITRNVKVFKCWLNEANAFALKEHFEIGTAATLDTVAILENRLINVTQLAYNLYECEVECLMIADVDYPQA